jgi:cobalt-zinc-cadmium efflux system outer membrane protein
VATLEGFLARALAQNPELRAEGERSRAAEERAAATGRLPEPEIKYELWSVPLARPLAFGQAMMHMVGVRQTFPAFGSRAALARAADAQTGASRATAARRLEDVVAEVRRGFAALQGLEEEIGIRLEHAGLLSRLAEVAGANYRSGKGTLQDELRIEAELVRLHAEITTVMQQLRVTAASLNVLAGREPGAALGPPSLESAPPPASLGSAKTPAALQEDRPELVEAAREVERSAAIRDAADRQASYPELMVGLDYMNQPMQPDEHGYGGMLSMSLPWLNPGRRAAVRSAEKSLAASRGDLLSLQLNARYEIVATGERYRAAMEVFLLEDTRAVPTARQSFELASGTYGAGGGDLTVLLEAWRAYLGARLARAQALARVGAAAAELDRAAGAGRAYAERLLKHGAVAP